MPRWGCTPPPWPGSRTLARARNALQTGAGRDDLSIVATVTMQSEDSVGLDAVTAERQEASAASNPVPEIKQQEAKREDAIEMDPPPPEESAPPQAPIQAKPVENPVEKQEERPSAPSLAAAAQEEQRAMSREMEARRNRAFSLYNAEIYKAIVTHADQAEGSRKWGASGSS